MKNLRLFLDPVNKWTEQMNNFYANNFCTKRELLKYKIKCVKLFS